MAEAPAAPVAGTIVQPLQPGGDASAPAPGRHRRALLPGVRRAIGAALIVLVVVPAWRLLDDPATGLAGSATAGLMRDVSGLLWSGALLALAPFVLLLFVGARLPLDAWLRSAARRIESVPARTFALLLCTLGTAAAAAFALFVFDARPNLIDAMTQLAHARLLAEGRLAGPVELAEFHFLTNSVLTEQGWVSQYPPGHVALLALGMLAGAEWLVGPLALGVALASAALIGERALPHARVAVRVLLLLACASPFLLAHAGSYMSHTTAAAFGGLAVLGLLRARDGDARWAIAAGAAASVALAIRPLSALAIVAATALAAWLPARDAAWALRRVGFAAAGALPLTLIHLWYNAHFFGSPFTLGYIAAFGPDHGLGFGFDPWGNAYGATQAVAYTSADLTALSLALFEVPLPVVVLVGVFLLLAPRLERGERVIAAWALAPVAANTLYWHHGLWMGPRMLNEVALAWVLLVALALAWLVRHAPESVNAGGVRRPRAALLGALPVVAVASLVLLVPARIAAWQRADRTPAPAPAAPALVFVHGPWVGRVGSRLSAAGLRSDSLETALRQNSTCTVARYADAREAGTATLPVLDFTPRAERALPRAEISPANFIRVATGEQMPVQCAAEIRADRLGVFELAPLLWQGAPPGSAHGVLFARDLGPARNRTLIRRQAGRTPWLYAAVAPDSAARLMPYDEGMRLVWGSTPVQVSR